MSEPLLEARGIVKSFGRVRALRGASFTVYAGEVVTPIAARELGIETVYQDLALAPDLESSANLFLGREATRGGLLGKLGFLDKAQMRRRTEEAFTQLGVGVQDAS